MFEITWRFMLTHIGRIDLSQVRWGFDKWKLGGDCRQPQTDIVYRIGFIHLSSNIGHCVKDHASVFNGGYRSILRIVWPPSPQVDIGIFFVFSDLTQAGFTWANINCTRMLSHYRVKSLLLTRFGPSHAKYLQQSFLSMYFVMNETFTLIVGGSAPPVSVHPTSRQARLNSNFIPFILFICGCKNELTKKIQLKV